MDLIGFNLVGLGFLNDWRVKEEVATLSEMTGEWKRKTCAQAGIIDRLTTKTAY